MADSNSNDLLSELLKCMTTMTMESVRPRHIGSLEIPFFFYPVKAADPNNRINLLVVLRESEISLG